MNFHQISNVERIHLVKIAENSFKISVDGNVSMWRARHFQNIFQEELTTFPKVTLHPWCSQWSIWKSKKGAPGNPMDEQTPRKQWQQAVMAQSPGPRAWWRADASSQGQDHRQKSPPLATPILNTVCPTLKQARTCSGTPRTGRYSGPSDSTLPPEWKTCHPKSSSK